MSTEIIDFENMSNTENGEKPMENLHAEIAKVESALFEGMRQKTAEVAKHISDNRWNWR